MAKRQRLPTAPNATRTRAVVLLTALLFACDRERVELGGYGASPPSSRMVPRGPAAPVAGSVSPASSSSPEVVTMPPLRAVPAPFVGLESRAAMTSPIFGGTLAVAANGGVAVVTDPDRDAAFVIDPNTLLQHSVSLPERSEPGRVVLDDMGHAHAVLRNAGKLARIELEGKQVSLSELLCREPRGLAYVAATKALHVACADGQLLQLSAADYSELARERHEPDLRDVLVLPDGSRAVSRFRSAQLLWLKPGSEHTSSPPVLPWPKLMPGASGPELGAVQTSATFAFKIAYEKGTGVWMLHERAQRDPLAPENVYHGGETACGAVVQPALSVFGSADDEPDTRVDLQLQAIAAPAVDLAVSPGAHWVAVATPSAFATQRATLQLQELELLQKQASIRSRAQAESEFKGSSLEVCSEPSFIALEANSQAIGVAFDDNSRLYVHSRFPSRLDVFTLVRSDASSGVDASASLAATVQLSDADVRDLGNEWFHAELGTSRLSCAACHAEGLDDAHTWVSGDKARRTPNLRGGLRQTAPFFWGGECDNFDALLTEVVTRQLGAANLSVKASVAMLGWLDRLPAISLTSNDPAVARGKTMFESKELSCAWCHSGPQLTNNGTVSPLGEDAGVPQDALQVPSLLGLALRAPYMHDGCAADLDALFREPACAGPLHRGLAAMSGEDADALRAYLLSL